jgi:hypothetical protein
VVELKLIKDRQYRLLSKERRMGGEAASPNPSKGGALESEILKIYFLKE